MIATLVLNSLAKAYSDAPQTTNPLMQSVNWTSCISVPVSDAKTDPFTVAPGATLTVFNGTDTTSIDNTTQFTLTLSPLLPYDRYRFTFTSGTAPVFRTDRGLALSTHAVTVTANANQTATFAASAGLFSAVQVGDTVFIPGVTTGDTVGPFNSLNEGLWQVLSVAGDGSSVQLGRFAGSPFQAYSETQTPSTNAQLIAFSASGVQVGDSVIISAGFAAVVQRSYVIVAITPTWFEVISTLALPVSAVAAPGITGIQFYNSAKRYIRVLADQDCIPRLNGDSGSSNRMSPWAAGDMSMMADMVKTGPTWSLTVQNISQVPMNLIVISAA